MPSRRETLPSANEARRCRQRVRPIAEETPPSVTTYLRLLQRTSKHFANCTQTSDRRRASSAIS